MAHYLEEIRLQQSKSVRQFVAQATETKIGLVGAVGIESASLLSKSNKENGVAPPPHFQLVPIGAYSPEATGPGLMDSIGAMEAGIC